MAVRKLDYDLPAMSNTRQQTVDNTRNNLGALADAIIMGRPPNVDASSGWQYSRVTGSGSAEKPQYEIWTNSATGGGTTQRIRATLTYSGNYVTQIVWEWTEDNGSTPNATGTWTSFCTQTLSYSSNNRSSGNNSSVFDWIYEMWGKYLDLVTNFNTHTGLGVGSAHGTGSIAAQSAAAVAITGGTINGTTVGVTTRAEARFTRAIEEMNATISGSGAQNVDWSKGGSYFSSTAAITFSFTNVPPNGFIGTHMLKVAHFDACTFPAAVDWGSGGKPTLGTNKAARVLLQTEDGGTTYAGSVYWRQA